MRYLFGFICVCALGVMPLVGCADAGGGSGGSAGSGGTAGTGGVSGSGGTDGSGGTGGVGGAGGAAIINACQNVDDLLQLCGVWLFSWVYVVPCVDGCFGDAFCTSNCLQDDPPRLSKPCADCYGTQAQCIRDKCVTGGGPCGEPIADVLACNECRFFGCDTRAIECVGDLSGDGEFCP